MAPHSTVATTVAPGGSAPASPKAASAAVTGTTSATVIQSMPSMKLTRLTNQMPASSRHARSSHHGMTGKMRSAAGSAAITMATAAACKTSRGTTSSGRMSSVTPTMARPSTAASVTASCRGSPNSPGAKTSAPATTIMVVAITAMPPPCGVGAKCDERALGGAKA